MLDTGLSISVLTVLRFTVYRVQCNHIYFHCAIVYCVGLISAQLSPTLIYTNKDPYIIYRIVR